MKEPLRDDLWALSSPYLERLDEVIDEVIRPQAVDVDRKHLFPRDAVRALGDAGLGILLMPSELGGGGAPTAVYAEALARVSAACGSTSTVYMTQMHCAHPLHLQGSAAQQERWIPALCSGEAIGAIALTEPSAGSDVASMRTVARRSGDSYVIRGGKTFISNGNEADIVVLFASVDLAAGKDGITAFAVETRDLAGFTAGAPMRKLGQRGASTVELAFDNCRVPAEARMGAEGAGYPLLLGSVTKSRISAAAQGVGFAQGAYQATVHRFHELGRLSSASRADQDLQFALAAMRARILAARALLHGVCELADGGGDEPTVEVSMAKLHCTALGVQVAAECVELLGEDGDDPDLAPERHLRDAKIAEIYDGTSQVQGMLIARDIRRSAGGG